MIKEFENLDERDPNINWDAFIPLIKNLQNKARKAFDMSHWHDSLDELNNKEEFCGTSCCIAGWVWVDENREVIDQTYKEAEQLQSFYSRPIGNSEIDDVIYERIQLQHKDMDLTVGSQQVSEFARQKLGLSYGQAGELFSCSYDKECEDDNGMTNVWFHNRHAIGLDLGWDDASDRELRPGLQDIDLDHAIKLLTGLFMGELKFPE